MDSVRAPFMCLLWHHNWLRSVLWDQAIVTQNIHDKLCKDIFLLQVLVRTYFAADPDVWMYI